MAMYPRLPRSMHRHTVKETRMYAVPIFNHLIYSKYTCQPSTYMSGNSSYDGSTPKSFHLFWTMLRRRSRAQGPPPSASLTLWSRLGAALLRCHA